MEELQNKEIRGISTRSLIGLLSSVIIIEFTILMSWNNVTSTSSGNKTRIEILEKKDDKEMDMINDLKTRISILESEVKYNK